jgi:DnaJ-class molecular chaperone
MNYSGTFYDLLNLSPSSSREEIRKSYRKCAIKWHSDKTRKKGTDEMMKKLNQAKEWLLSNEEKRAEYNRKHNLTTKWKDDNNDPSSSYYEYISKLFYEDQETDAFKNHVNEPTPIIRRVTIQYEEWQDPYFVLNNITYKRTDLCSHCCGYGWCLPKKLWTKRKLFRSNGNNNNNNNNINEDGREDYYEQVINIDEKYQEYTKVCFHCSGMGYCLKTSTGVGREDKAGKSNNKRDNIDRLKEAAMGCNSVIDVCKKCKGNGRLFDQVKADTVKHPKDIPPLFEELKRTKETKDKRKWENIEERATVRVCKECNGEGLLDNELTIDLSKFPLPRHIERSSGIGVLCIKNIGNIFRRTQKRGDFHIVIKVEAKTSPFDSSYVIIPVVIDRMKSHKSFEYFNDYNSDNDDDDDDDDYGNNNLIIIRGKTSEEEEINFDDEHVKLQMVSFKPLRENLYGTIKLSLFHHALFGVSLRFPTDLKKSANIKIERDENGLLTENTRKQLNMHEAIIEYNVNAFSKRREKYKEEEEEERDINNNNIDYVTWDNDKWFLSGWGPSLCPFCAMPPFVDKIKNEDVLSASASYTDLFTRSNIINSNYVPSYAPSFYVNSCGVPLRTKETNLCCCFFPSIINKETVENEEAKNGDIIITFKVERPTCNGTKKSENKKEEEEEDLYNSSIDGLISEYEEYEGQIRGKYYFTPYFQ